jgi:hypothetical protein
MKTWQILCVVAAVPVIGIIGGLLLNALSEWDTFERYLDELKKNGEKK